MKRFALILAMLFDVACDKKQVAPEPEPAASVAAVVTTTTPNIGEIEAPEVTVRPAGTKVHVAWRAPEGTGLNDDAPVKVRWKHSEGLAEEPPEMKSTGSKVKEGFDIDVLPLAGAARATLTGTIDLVVCDVRTHKVCVPVKRKLDLGFIVDKGAPAEAPLVVQLPEAKVD